MLRNRYKLARSRLPDKIKYQIANQVTEWFVASQCFKEATHIATYLSSQHELNTEGIVDAIWRAGKCCYLPSIDVKTKAMNFILYERHTKLQINVHGILEPTASVLIEKTMLDLVLVPLVAFDNHGFRLGMGAGYYDRAFAYLASKEKSNKPLLIGLAYAEQEAHEVYPDSWDVRLHAVITEKGIKWFDET